MGFGEKLGATLATKYGVVTSGKYKDCQLAMGNPAGEKKVETTNRFSQIILVEGNEEKGRYEINKMLMMVHGNNAEGVQMSFRAEDGTICEFDLLLRPKDKMWMKLVRTFFGQKGGIKSTSEGGVEATLQEEKNLRFHNIKVFFEHVLVCLRNEDVDFFEEYFMENDVLDDMTKKFIEIYRKTKARQ